MQAFDAFLVGDGSARLMEGYVEDVQLSRQALVMDAVDSLVDIKEDVETYGDSSQTATVSNREDIDAAFYLYKKETYDIFGYVELKSSWMRGVPVKLEDLVLEDADKYLIDYLASTVTDLYVWKQLARLQACLNMGISHVRFQSSHDCAICKSLKGKIISVENLLRVLCRGGNLSHAFCPCDVIPVVYREKYDGALKGALDKDVVIWGDKDLLHVPLELLFEETGLAGCIDGGFPWIEVDFVNMPLWCEENKIKDSQGLVVYAEDETLYVHNSYVGNSTPVDYLTTFLNSPLVPDTLTEEDKLSAVSYWMDGREVLKHGGHYYAPTGERLR